MSAVRRRLIAHWMRIRTLANLYLRRRPPVVIYQMGKVGSRSLYDSLRSTPGVFVTHVHRMHPGNIAAVAAAHQARRRRPEKEVVGPLLHAHAVERGRPLQVITLVRDPVARNLSAFFQNLAIFTDVSVTPMTGPEGKVTGRVAELGELFLTAYPHDVPLTWFDDELGAELGVDVFATPFPQAAGYCEITGSRHRVLVLKLEAGDEIIARAVKEFLDLPQFVLHRTNVGVEKPYAGLYDDVREKIRLPGEYLERMYSSRLARHFYSAAERAGFRRRWQGGEPGAGGAPTGGAPVGGGSDRPETDAGGSREGDREE